jgi:hypothetical protein
MAGGVAQAVGPEFKPKYHKKRKKKKKRSVAIMEIANHGRRGEIIRSGRRNRSMLNPYLSNVWEP